MKLYLVRHGDPNYADDCLTPLGRVQAAAAAERLKGEGIEKIFSSTCGRAVETAGYTARALKLEEPEKLYFMREFSWGSRSGEEIFAHGRPWSISDRLAEDNESNMDPDWAKGRYYENNYLMDFYSELVPAADEFLGSLGVKREGLYYRVENCPYKTVALFSHGGSSSGLIAHIFNLPYTFVTSAICPECTAITVISFEENKNCTVAPKFEICNDARHILGLCAEV